MASGDRRREWHIRDRIRKAETELLPANAAESWVALRSDCVENLGRTAPENEMPKIASGDRRWERRIRDRIQEAETEPPPANAAEPRAFRARIRN